MSAIAWYEYARGPRPPHIVAVGRTYMRENGIIPFAEDLASKTAEVFRQLGSPRKRAADIAIGVTAAAFGATLITRNGRDFTGIPDLSLEVVSSGD